MRPDVALLISIEGVENVEPSWLHFDAKYRLEKLADLLGGSSDTPEEEQRYVRETSATESAGSPKRSDLLKMHAYRDAIRRSSGAYVLYPGDQEELLQPYDEILPGLGAFVLRPTERGSPEGIHALHSFLEQVLDHFASQLSQHERERHWVKESHLGRPVHARAAAAGFLTKPPADTRVLLGYVRSANQLAWIRRESVYNMRAGPRQGAVELGADELGASFLVLYGPHLEEPELWQIVGHPRVVTREWMITSGYESPGGDLYFCLEIQTPVSDYKLATDQVAGAKLRAGGSTGQPVTVTWEELVTSE
jgi:hypothetical protein